MKHIMAFTSGNSASRSRRNIKLESFLQRTLTEEEFSNVRAYASCVVDSTNDRYTFRHVVLTDSTIYLTQHPPRSIYEATKVADIVDIKLVHDDPWFLNGKDKENCQHVQLLCKYPRGFKKTSWRNGRLSVSEQDIGQSASANSSPQSWRKIIRSLNLSSSRRNSDEIRTDSKDSNDNDNSWPSTPMNRDSSGFAESISSSPEYYHRENNQIKRRMKFSSLPLDSHSSLYFPIRNIPSLDSGISESSDEAKDSFSPFSSLETWPSNVSSKFFKSQSALGFYHPHLHHYTAGSVDESHVRCHSTSALLREQKMADFGSTHFPKSTSLEIEESPKANIILNFYMLESQSLFISSLFTVRTNYVIRATLALEDDLPETQSSKKKNKGELTEKLFDDLKREITTSQISVEELFHLLQELKTAAKKHIIVRSLFWKNSSLPQFLFDRLQHHLDLLASSNDISDDDLLSDCEDELQMIVLILETLTAMFRETESVLARSKHFKSNKNKFLKDILVIVTTCTKIPSKYFSTSNRMLTSVEEFSSHSWENLPESELIKLLAEVVTVKLNLLYEIIFALEQDDELKIFNVCEFIADNKSFELYVHHMMTQIMSLLMNGYDAHIRPRNAVQLYKCLYILKEFLSFPLIEKIIWHSYNENFRYCVANNPLSVRIPNFYPIKDLTVDLFNEINRIMCERKSLWNE